MMVTVKIEGFNVVGIRIRTTNENEKGATDIPALWHKFMSEGFLNKIPNKVSDEIYAIYTNYESDYTKPYDMFLGCKVSSLEKVPEEMESISFESQEYQKFVAKGNLNEGVVYKKWVEIWNTEINRAYTADFEIYGEKSQNPKDAEVDIFISLK